MAMYLIDRPHLDHDATAHQGLSAAASVALHAAVVLPLIVMMRMSPDGPLQDRQSTALLSHHLIWIPHEASGGGSDGGGQRAADPPRRVRTIGRDAASIAAIAQHASTDSANEPREDLSTLPARPMGDATQYLAGTIESDGISAGPGETGAGTTKSPADGGLGKAPVDGFGPGAIRGNPGVTTPALILRVAPKYTVEAMQARIQGSVWVECVVLPDGSIGDARVMRSLDRRFGLDDEAIAAARRWRFRPGTLHGKPVPVVVTIELTFNVR